MICKGNSAWNKIRLSKIKYDGALVKKTLYVNVNLNA